ncbi:hypothetical protein BKA93DRAFT_748550 [Sparassis latifolia]
MRDALRLSVTTQGLHMMAVQQALSHVKIVGKPTATPVIPVSPSRLSHLQSLALLLKGSWNYQISSAALITDLLMQLRTSPNFWSLSIGPVGRLQFYESQFIEAISALPYLKTLELCDWSAHWLPDVLNELRGPPSRLALTSLHGQSMSLLFFLAEQPLLEGLALLDLSGTSVAYSARFVCYEQQGAAVCIGSCIPQHLRAAWQSACTLRQRGGCDILGGARYRLRSAFRIEDVAAMSRAVVGLEYGERVANGDQQDIVSALRNMSPVVLSFTASTQNDLSFWQDVVRAVPTLHALRMELYTSRSRLQTWIDNVPQILASIDIICLQIDILDSMCHDAIRDIWPMRIAQSIPSLRYISLGFRADRPRTWHPDVSAKSHPFYTAFPWWCISGT